MSQSHQFRNVLQVIEWGFLPLRCYVRLLYRACVELMAWKMSSKKGTDMLSTWKVLENMVPLGWVQRDYTPELFGSYLHASSLY